MSDWKDTRSFKDLPAEEKTRVALSLLHKTDPRRDCNKPGNGSSHQEILSIAEVELLAMRKDDE